MKTLVIHKPEQPSAKDFCHAIPGELAMLTPAAWLCTNRHCGCDHSFVGMNSGAASTTVVVTEIALTVDEMILACTDRLDAVSSLNFEQRQQAAQTMVGDAIELAAFYDLGTVLRTQYHPDQQAWEFSACDCAH